MGARKKKRASSTIHDEIFEGFSARSDRGRKSREQGVVFERKVANALKPLFPNARRMSGQSRAGNEVPDVGGTPYWIECSDGATRAIHEKLAQGLVAAGSSPSAEYVGRPVVVVSHHGRRQETMATMRLEDFIRLLAKIPKTKKR